MHTCPQPTVRGATKKCAKLVGAAIGFVGAGTLGLVLAAPHVIRGGYNTAMDRVVRIGHRLSGAPVF